MYREGCLAIDIGASGGKCFAGSLSGDRLVLEEIHRFSNKPFSRNGYSFWNAADLHKEVLRCIEKASTLQRYKLDSIGIDTWGVDFGLLSASGSLLGNPLHYRNMFGTDIMDRALEHCGNSWLFDRSPTQFQPFNTLFQLIALREWMPELLESATTLLPMASLLSFFLCGAKATEFTMATTTQLFDPDNARWSKEILDCFDLPDIMTEIVPPGTQLGSLTGDAQKQAGCDIKIILPATHDTASAVASIPLLERTMFISSGTWFLEGVVVDRPIRKKEVLERNYANEGCFDGTYRMLKNLTGLWLLERLLREWKSANPELDYPALQQMAENFDPMSGVLDVESPLLKNPENMQEAIIQECSKNSPTPRTKGQLVRAVLEGIAHKTAQVRKELEHITGQTLERIHIVGGGVRNTFLCQLISNYCELEVIAGPEDGTALGNIIVQLLSLGKLRSIEEAHDLISASFELRHYWPKGLQVF